MQWFVHLFYFCVFFYPSSGMSGGDFSFHVSSEQSATSVTKPITEFQQNEASVALAWVPNQPSCLAVGTSFKWLRIYDLRTDVNVSRYVMAHNKTVNGVRFDPFNDNQLATFSDDGLIKVWDIRKLNKATLTLKSPNKNIRQISWCPTRSGILTSIADGENCLRLWDLQNSGNIGGDMGGSGYSNDKWDVYQSQPCKTMVTTEPVASVSWSFHDDYRMMMVLKSGVVTNRLMHESIPMHWSAFNDLVLAYGKRAFQHQGNELCRANKAVLLKNASMMEELELDISQVMKTRCIQGYATDCDKNIEILHQNGEEQLERVWTWIATMERMFTVSVTEGKSPYKQGSGATKLDCTYPGVCSILRNASQARDVSVEQVLLQKQGSKVNTGTGGSGYTSSMQSNSRSLISYPTYRSPRRQLVLLICNWGFDGTQQLIETKLQSLEDQGRFEEAAAMALFNLDLERSIASLVKGGEIDQRLQLVAFSLAGFSNRSNQIWKNLCETMSQQTENPYLVAMFGFLGGEGKTFDSILFNEELPLSFRVAFACKFLDDDSLLEYYNAIE
eukprot:TRINITY_DN2900_c0_g1_i8.p1 TRINITY_DN2900_c0_g1~~TRINITY_DN2900_c0_g1_i8.p1  ORF type:complete len:558 (+),score=144.40 TRINITY_DN2900_c0_g1_i8:62-1735(+)